MYYSRFGNLCQVALDMFWSPFELEFGLNHLRLKRRIFLEQDTMRPYFGLRNREREKLRFHVSIIADSLFIVKLWFGRESTGTGINFGKMRVLLEEQSD